MLPQPPGFGKFLLRISLRINAVDGKETDMENQTTDRLSQRADPVKGGRKLHLDLLRMIAIVLVVYNHTDRNGCFYYLQIPDSFWRLPLIALAYVMRCAVSVFFMISGALLLGKSESLRDLYRKRVLRFAVVLVVASFLSYLFKIRQNLSGFSLYQFVYGLVTTGHCYAYWFLYLYLAWLICLPFLRKMAQNMSNREFQYLFLVVAATKLLAFVPLVLFREPSSFNGYFIPFVVDRTVMFPLLGYYLEERVPDRFFCRRTTVALLLAMLAATVVTVASENFWLSQYMHWEDNGGEGYYSVLGFVPAVLLYYLAKLRFLRRAPGRVEQRVISLFGGCSFGLYLFQHMYLEMTDDLVFRNVFGTWLGTVVWVLSVCLLGTAVVWLLRKIPGVKRLI